MYHHPYIHMTSFCGLCYEITENSKKNVGMGWGYLCSVCITHLVCTLPSLHLVSAVLAFLSIHPSTLSESVLYTSSIHRNVNSNTYRKTVPELESLCLCSEGMGVPTCMQV